MCALEKYACIALPQFGETAEDKKHKESTMGISLLQGKEEATKEAEMLHTLVGTLFA